MNSILLIIDFQMKGNNKRSKLLVEQNKLLIIITWTIEKQIPQICNNSRTYLDHLTFDVNTFYTIAPKMLYERFTVKLILMIMIFREAHARVFHLTWSTFSVMSPQ